MKTSPTHMPLKVETRFFSDDGSTPNNRDLPLLIFRGTGAEEHHDAATWFQRRFVIHDWGSPWRWTVYPYHHYHSTNHEVLGVSRGTARLIFGGESGQVFEVNLGDTIVIPAGVGHKRLDSSSDFEVVGAYPGGREPDLIASGEGDISTARERIAQLLIPRLDPLYGADGPLQHYWKL